MAEYTSAFLRALSERGYIHQCSDAAGLDQALMAGVVPAYIGFDCTAPSLHVGSLVQIMMLRWLQKTGHKPIVLMGGGTTQVGDPSGKDESRQLLSLDTIAANKEGILQVFSKFLTFGDGETDAVMVDNADWLLQLGYIPFLREVGSHISVNQMIQRDSVKLRLEREHHLSFLEFNYMVLQAYDFVELARRYGCRLQMGGSDQWGNIVAGIDLGRRLADAECFALTSPLITTASGAKMGKTAEGAVWLDSALFTPYDYWQFWRNTADADVARFLKMFTDLPIDRIETLAGAEGGEINEAKKELATEATALLHGREAAEAAAETARRTFEEGESAAGLPTLEVARSEIEAGIGILTLYVQAGLAASNSEVRKAVANNAIKINDQPISDPKAQVGADDLTDGVIKLSFGRKKHVLVRPV